MRQLVRPELFFWRTQAGAEGRSVDLLLTTSLPRFVSLSLTCLVAPGGMFATAEANRIIRGACWCRCDGVVSPLR